MNFITTVLNWSTFTISYLIWKRDPGLGNRWNCRKLKWKLGTVRRELQNVFKEKLGLENVQIERAHQVRNKGNKDKKDQINKNRLWDLIQQIEKESSKKR